MRFFLEATFELFICISLTFKMKEIRQVWSPQDSASFYSAMVMLVLLLIFLLIFIDFLMCKQPKLVNKKRLELMESHADLVESYTRMMVNKKSSKTRQSLYASTRLGSTAGLKS